MSKALKLLDHMLFSQKMLEGQDDFKEMII